ncbi:MAG: FG-GAP repeat domain-containing protein [Candidatus Hydrogenedentota bacterium]
MKSVAIFCMFLMCVVAAGDTFTEHGELYGVGPNPSGIVAVDLNDNGWPDIVTADRGSMGDPRDERPANDELAMLVAEGDLEYSVHPPLRADFAPYNVVAANVSSPRYPDLVVGSFMATRGRDITYYRHIGDNLFEPEVYTVPEHELSYTRMRDSDDRPVFTQPGVTAVVVEDFTGNGHMDIVAAGWSSDVLIVWRGQEPEGDGEDEDEEEAEEGEEERRFGEPEIISAPGGIRNLAAADFDGDGELDLATVFYATGEVGLWRGDGEGSFVLETRFSSRGKLPHTIRVVDVNGDGEEDLIVSHCHADDSVVIFYGDGGFRFSLSQEILLGEDRDTIEHEIRDVAVTDFTGNGRPDIALACYASEQVVVLTNRSEDASIPQEFERETYSFRRGRPRALAVADFNQNGAPDLGVTLWEANDVGLLLNTREEEEEE